MTSLEKFRKSAKDSSYAVPKLLSECDPTDGWKVLGGQSGILTQWQKDFVSHCVSRKVERTQSDLVNGAGPS